MSSLANRAWDGRKGWNAETLIASRAQVRRLAVQLTWLFRVLLGTTRGP